jgi:2,3-bisphosphoglycerate-independent phosphoglycerate mutase
VTDGRDTGPHTAIGFLSDLDALMRETKTGKFATLSGRYFAMDRDHNWERTDKAFNAMIKGEGKTNPDIIEAIKLSYEKDVTDEFIEPVVIDKDGLITDGDVVIMVNFRNDRPRQMTERLLQMGPKNLEIVTMTRYNPDYPVKVLFSPIILNNSMGEVVSKAGLKQLRVTETEKFAHMTFFLNCKRELPFEGEDRIMLDSNSDVPTHDLKPEMRAADIAREVVQALEGKSHQMICTNICNADMVGHSGNFPAIVKAVEAADKAVGEVIEAALKNNYEVIITADHGNAEQTIDDANGEPLTSHTLNPVPFILVSKRFKELAKDKGTLIDIAPTILKLLEIKKPKEMTGESLV